MAAMLSKFRIDFSDVIVITDITQKPNENTRHYFDTLTQKFLKNEHGASKLTCFFNKVYCSAYYSVSYRCPNH